MDFEIKNLQGEWKQWATEADEHKKGIRDEKINSTFEESYILNAAFNAGKTVEDVKKIFGAEFAEKYQKRLDTNNANIDRKSSTAEDAEDDVINNYLATSREDFVKNPDWKEYANSLKQAILSPENNLTNRGYYTTLANQVETVANAMSKYEFNSRDEVKDLYEKVKDDLESVGSDKFKKFKLEVLRQMVLTAETAQKTKEMNLLKDEYENLRTEKHKSREEAYESIQADSRFKGSYFHDYWGQDYSAKFSHDGTMRLNQGLIHELEDTVIMDDARKEVFQAIEAQRRKSVDDPRSSRRIEKDAKKAMGEAYDKYSKKVFKGELSFIEKATFTRSNVKAHRKEIAIDENVENIKSKNYTEKDIKDEIKNDLIFNALLKNGLITEADEVRNNEKTYNITGLSDKIRERVGANLIADKQPGDLYPYDEVENIVKDIIVNANGQDVSKDDVKDLIEFCGFKIMGKNWVRIVTNAVADTIIPGASALVGAASLPNQVYDKTHPLEINVNNKVHAKLNLNITGADASLDRLSLMKSLKECGFGKDNIQLKTTENGFQLILDKTDSQSFEGEPLHFYEEFSNRAGQVALRTLIASFALNMLSEAFADKQGEIPTVVTQFQYTSIEDYNAGIDADKKLTKAQKTAIKELADAYIQRDDKGNKIFDENGNPVWDVNEFKNCLDRIAGSESMLSAHEFHIGINKEIKRKNDELIKILTNLPKIKQETEEIITTKKETPEEVLTVPHTWKHNESWQAIIATYYPDAFEEFKDNLKPLVDAFRKCHNISFKSGIPVGQTQHLDNITINGKTYAPQTDQEGQRLAKFTSNKWFGWGSTYFTGEWKFPVEETTTLTGGARVKPSNVTYTSTRKSDSKTNTGTNELATQDALKPDLKPGVETTVTVTNSDGTTREYKIKSEEENK